MRILIAITSCVKFALNGSNQASRDTWMKELPKFPNVECKFFMGDGTPADDGEKFQVSLRDCPHVHLDDPRVSLDDPNPYALKQDEVRVHAPDDYIYHTWKTQAYLRWALERNFDHIFNAAGDTYIALNRLMNSGYAEHDYVGRKYGPFAVGGSGYWLSRKAAQYIVYAKADDWATDRWIGFRLLDHGIVIHGDQRYGASPQQNPGLADPSPLFPEPHNIQITAHLAEAPGHYTPSLMYTAHELRGQDGLNERFSNDSRTELRLASIDALRKLPSEVRLQRDEVNVGAEHIRQSTTEPAQPRFQSRRLRPR